MQKTLLMTPGPTPVPEEVALAMARPIIHHRSPAFEALFAEVREGLKWICGTNEEVLTFACSGTGAMEGAVVNFLRRGEKAVVVDAGKFGERWKALCAAYGIEIVVARKEWGEAADPSEIAALLDANPDARAVLMTACESSTGVLHPVREIAALCRDRDVLSVVDAVSALGTVDLPFDSMGIDVLVAASQKGLMLPPGLGFGVASARAWKRNEKADLPRFYFDWRHEREVTRKNQTSFTPPVSLIVGLREVIRMLRAEGRERTLARHDRLARATRAAMEALGLPIFAKRPAPALTTVVVPVDSDQLVKVLRERYGVFTSGGQDQARGRILRLAHLGWCWNEDVLATVAAVERGLLDLGQKVELGTGVSAALKVFATS